MLLTARDRLSLETPLGSSSALFDLLQLLKGLVRFSEQKRKVMFEESRVFVKLPNGSRYARLTLVIFDGNTRRSFCLRHLVCSKVSEPFNDS